MTFYITLRRFVFWYLTGIYFIMPGYSQHITEEVLRKNVQDYYAEHIREKIFLYTDRSLYLSGETVWFKLYNLDKNTGKPLELSRVAYVELLSGMGEPVQGLKIPVNGSTGSGYLVIPEESPSGYYYLRAYTHWMKNHEPESYFISPLAIVNPRKRLYETLDSTLLVNREIIHLEFFPEGGKLIAGIENLIVISATDGNGTPVAVRGGISNSAEGNLSGFETLKEGLCSVRIIPEEGEKYYATITGDRGQNKEYYLPDPLMNEITLQCRSENGDDLIVLLNSGSHNAGGEFYLLVLNRDGLTFFDNRIINSFPRTVRVTADKLADGENQVILLDKSFQIISQRKWWQRYSDQLVIEVTPGKTTYKQREQVILDIYTTDVSGNPVSADLFISAALSGLLHNKQNDILKNLQLDSFYPGISFPCMDIADSVARAGNDLQDLLMLASRVDIPELEEMLKGESQPYLFYPELEGLTLSGTVIDPSVGKTVSGVDVCLSIVGEVPFLEVYRTNEEGRFYFELNEVYGQKDIVLNFMENSHNYLIRTDEQFSDRFATLPATPLMLDENWRVMIQRLFINYQLQNAYADFIKNQEVISVGRQEAFYVLPDLSINMNEFVRLPVMEEVFRELVKRTVIVKESGENAISIVDFHTNRIIGNAPVFLVDGVPFFESRSILGLNPEVLSMINLVSFKYFRELLEMDGIVDIRTNDGDLTFPELPVNAVRQYFQAYQMPAQFQVPDFDYQDESTTRLPYFRNLIYWNPNVKTNEEGRARVTFNTSDDTGKYHIQVEGLSSSGMVGSAGKYIVIEK